VWYDDKIINMLRLSTFNKVYDDDDDDDDDVKRSSRFNNNKLQS